MRVYSRTVAAAVASVSRSALTGRAAQSRHRSAPLLRRSLASQAEQLREFTTSEYEEMRDDTARTDAYARALRAVVQPHHVVVDVGTGCFALLAIEAARAGADHVYAIEANFEAYEAARRAVTKAGLDASITVVYGAASAVTLPEKADVLVHELLGEIAGRESSAAIIRAAVPRLCHSGTVSIPASARSWCVPAELQVIDARGLPMLVPPPEAATLRIHGFDFAKHALAAPRAFELLDYSKPGRLSAVCETTVDFTVERDGLLGGFSCFLTCDMLTDEPFTLDRRHFDSPHAPTARTAFSSAWPGTSWANPVVRLNCVKNGSIFVAEGDVVRATMGANLRAFKPVYSLRAHLLRRPAAGDEGFPEECLLTDVSFE